LKERYHISIRNHLGAVEIPAATGTLDPSMGGRVAGLGGARDFTLPGSTRSGKVIEGKTVLQGITFVPKDFQLLLDLFRSAKNKEGDAAFHYHPLKGGPGGGMAWTALKDAAMLAGLDLLELSYDQTKIGMPGAVQERAWGFREIADADNTVVGPLEQGTANYPGKDRFELKFGHRPASYARRVDITSLHVALTPSACNIHIDDVGFVLRGPRSVVGLTPDFVQHLVNELLWKSILRDALVDKYGNSSKAVWAVDHLSLMLPSSDTRYAPTVGAKLDLGGMQLTAAFSFDCKCLNSERLTLEERIVPISEGSSVGLGFEVKF
jgi:hypothetical protein